MNIKIISCAIATSLILLGCDRSPEGVVDPPINGPVMVGVTISPTGFNTDTIFVQGKKDPSDQIPLTIHVDAAISPQGGIVQSLQYTITRLGDGTSLTSGSLPLTAEERSTIANTPPQSYTTIHRDVIFQIQRSDVGGYNFEMSALGESGLESSAFLSSISVIRENLPPQLSDLQAPSEVNMPDVGAVIIYLSVKAVDPNGQDDIQRVQFTTILPNGNPSSAGAIEMFDDGSRIDLGGYTSGDIALGDSIFTRSIQLPAGATPGNYIFNFIAIDNSRDTSNVLTQIITVQ